MQYLTTYTTLRYFI